MKNYIHAILALLALMISVLCLTSFSLEKHQIIGSYEEMLNSNDTLPVPEEIDHLLFYIQRNHNTNTIIYESNFDKMGNLMENKPIDVYWIRYEEEGQRMELRRVEKMFAYGVKCTDMENYTNQYKVELVASEDRIFTIKQIRKFEAVVYTEINNKQAKLERMYIEADNSGFWPEVKYIELYGRDESTNRDVYEKFIP